MKKRDKEKKLFRERLFLEIIVLIFVSYFSFLYLDHVTAKRNKEFYENYYKVIYKEKLTQQMNLIDKRIEEKYNQLSGKDRMDNKILNEVLGYKDKTNI